jgi:type IV secretory pathway TrbF-like protein
MLLSTSVEIRQSKIASWPTIRRSRICVFTQPRRTPDPETPYQRAAQAWDDRIGSARVQARNWRLAFFGMLALSGGLSAGLVWQSARGHIVPWVVEVDKLGEARAIEPATADYRPTDPQDPQWRYGASR